MRKTMLIACAALIGATGASQPNAPGTQEAKIAAALKGLVAEQPQACATLRGSYSTIRAGSTIIYKLNRNLAYRTETSGGCESGLNNDDILVTRVSNGRLCRGDLANTYNPYVSISTGSCSLGNFTRYRAQ